MGPVQCHLPCLLASGSAKLDNSNYQSKFKTQLLYFILNESHTCLFFHAYVSVSTMVRVQLYIDGQPSTCWTA